ncbi:MAG: holo-ACP synthase [Planctomycetes bacterium]|nr:holo-ACP synthase [Planctomycetota bacterium]
MILGLGVDVCEVSHLRSALERHGRRFERRVFTAGEQAYCRRRKRSAESYAARFAAKEAAMKALGTGWARGVRWRDLEVVREPGQAPSLLLHGAAARRAKKLGVRRIHLALTHSGDQAIAFLVMEGRSG